MTQPNPSSNEREELIEELLIINMGSSDKPYEQVADFIIKDRAKILEPLVSLRFSKKPFIDWETAGKLCNTAIDEALKRAGLL